SGSDRRHMTPEQPSLGELARALERLEAEVSRRLDQIYAQMSQMITRDLHDAHRAALHEAIAQLREDIRTERERRAADRRMVMSALLTATLSLGWRCSRRPCRAVVADGDGAAGPRRARAAHRLPGDRHEPDRVQPGIRPAARVSARRLRLPLVPLVPVGVPQTRRHAAGCGFP